MVTFKCKMCGGQLEIQEGQSVCTCEFCGTSQTVPHFDNEKKATFFKRAHDLRFKCEFDKATGVYETIVTEYPNEAEAYWGLVLCKYGIEYVDDPKTKKKIPTCHRTQFASIFDDHDYLSAIRCADAVARELYKREANAISKLQNAILEISFKEDPFDVFICYKETDDRGGRTPDSVLAQDIFDELSSAGYKVFFSRRTLERKLGSEYEPYIFAALHSAKVMVHVTSSKANSEAVWVRNEWSRYLSLIAEGQKKILIPCYKGISAYDLPDEMKNLQGQDMSKLGAMQDLIYGIKKILKPTGRAVEKAAEDAPASSDTGYDALVRKGHTYLKNHKMEQAKRCFEKAIEAAELCGDAYLGMLLCEYQLESLEELLAQSDLDILASENFNLSREFANKSCNETLNKVEEAINRNKKLEKYNQAKSSLDAGRYNDAIEQFQKLGDFENSEEMILECVYQKGQMYFGYINSIKNIGYCDDAINCFNEVVKYKDSKEMIDKINSLKANIVAEYKASCIAKYEIELPKEVTLVTLNELAKKVKANRDRVFTPNYDEFDDTRTNVEVGVIKFFVEKTPALIQSLTALDECSKLRDLCSSIEKYGNLKAVYPLIEQRESGIKEQLAVLKKKKRKKTLTITGLISGVLAVAVASFFGIKAIVDENNRKATYASANTAMESGNYDNAIAYYESLGNYQDSQKKIQVCNGLKQLEASIESKKEEDAIKGIKTIVSAGEKVDVTYEAENNLNIKRLAGGGNSENKTETIETVDFTFYQPSLKGYSFLNWNSESLSYKSDRTYLGLMSNWSLNTYTITFDCNSGSFDDTTTVPTIYSVESEDINLPSPKRTGYTFVGWTSGGEYVAKIPHGSIGDMSFKANWTANKYVITLDPNGGAVNPSSINVTYDANYSLPTPSKNNYGFAGWYDSLNKKWTDGIYQTEGNVTLTAHWSADTFTITYVLNGGTNNSQNPLSYTTEDVITFKDPSRTGYHFDGWFDNNGNQITGISKGSSGDITLNARWIINTYTVTFKNYNGTTLEIKQVNHGSSVTYTGATPTKPATAQYTYTFTGWDKSLSNITSDLVLTAQFGSTVNKYTIIWKNYDGSTLKIDSLVYGSIPSYSGVTPTKSSDEYYTYTFSGWTPSVVAVVGDATYTAVFEESLRIIFELDSSSTFYWIVGTSNLSPETINIPESFNNLPVGGIRTNSFAKCTSTKTIIIPSSVDYIEEGSFYNCSSLESLTIPFAGFDGTNEVPSKAGFGYIFGEIEFENTTISKYNYGSTTQTRISFYIPNSLETVIIKNDKKDISLEVGAFRNCSNIKRIEIGMGIVKIGDDTFNSCKGLQEVIIGDSTLEVGAGTFYSCSSLESVSLGNNIEKIGTSCFAWCTSLTSLYIPESVSEIGESTFHYCSSLQNLSVPFVGKTKNATYYEQLFGHFFGTEAQGATYDWTVVQIVNQNYVSDSYGSRSYVLPKSLKNVEVRGGDIFAYAFEDCTMIENITLSNGVTSIGNGAFRYCSSLKNINVPGSITTISDYAFYYCSGLTNVNISNGVTHVGKYAFSNCTSISSLTLANSITILDEYCFHNCSNLSYITFLGTKAQWNSIQKKTNWNYLMNPIVVHCSDGDINS